MSLDNIQLPSFVIQHLFRKTLVDTGDNNIYKKDSKEPEIPFLGSNKQNITILVNNTEEGIISEKQLNFLSGILSACKLTMQDVALINLNSYPKISYKSITEIFNSKIIFLFGISSNAIELPFIIPAFQKQNYNSQIYLSAPSLEELEHNKDLKRQFWNVLKQIFSL